MIYFISGHRNISDVEFKENYIPKLDSAISNNGRFVVGDYYGVDMMAQEYLKGKVLDEHVTVYHMLESPRNYIENFHSKGGYILDEERDAAMTNESHTDIAWSRTERSGTARNLERRIEFDHIKWLQYIHDNMDAESKAALKVMYEAHLKKII